MASWLQKWGAISFIASSMVMGIAGSALAQSDAERAGARAAAEAGLSAFNSGRYSEALDLLSRAESIVHALPHLLYMARSAEKLGRLVQARELYLKIAREQLVAGAPRAFIDAQQAAQQELAGIDARLPYLTVHVEGARANDVKITMDDREIPAVLVGVPFPVDPGSHTLVMTSPLGQRSDPVIVTLAEGKRERVALKTTNQTTPAADPAKASTPVSAVSNPGASTFRTQAKADPKLDQGAQDGSGKSPVMTYGALGLGVVGAAVGTVFLLQRGSKQSAADEAFAACKTRLCSAAEQDEILQNDKSAATAGTISLIGFGVGGAALAAGLYLLFSSDSTAKQPLASGHVTPYVSPTGAGAVVVF